MMEDIKRLFEVVYNIEPPLSVTTCEHDDCKASMLLVEIVVERDSDAPLGCLECWRTVD